jgi:WD40 repeat protein
VLDLSEILPGFAREPRQIVRSTKTHDFAKSQYFWSPDSKQLLVKLGGEAFVLEADRLNPTAALTNIALSLESLKSRWQKEDDLRAQTRLTKLPPELAQMAEIQFSPDESKILYAATGSSTPRLYVYDLKEKENFYIMDKPTAKQMTKISWFPTSKHLFLVQKDKQSLPLGSGKISVIETDGQNPTDLWAGQFEAALPFPSAAGNKILVLTSIGKDTLPNLYAVSLR